MADLERNLKIGVNVNTTKTGPSADAELAKLREQIRGAKDDTAAYNAWLERNTAAQVEASKQTQSLSGGQADLSKTTAQLSDNVGKAQTKLDPFLKSKKDWLAISKGVSTQMPIVGRALALLTNPLAAMTAGLGLTVALFAELYRQSKALATEVKIKPVADDTAALAEAFTQASASSSEFFGKLTAGKSALENINTAAERHSTLLKEQADAQKMVAEAELELARAKLERMRQSGEISEDEFARRSAGLSVGTSVAARQQRASEIAAARQQLADLERQQNNISRAPAGYAQAAAESQRDWRARQLAEVNAEMAAYKEKDKATGLRADEFSRLNQLEKARMQLELEVEEWNEKARKAAEATAATEKTILDLNTAIEKLKEKINQLTEVDRIRTGAELKAYGIRAQAAQMGVEAGRGKILNAGADAADAALAGGKLTDQQTAAIQQAAALLGQQNRANTQAFIVLLAQLNNDAKAMKKALADAAAQQKDGLTP